MRRSGLPVEDRAAEAGALTARVNPWRWPLVVFRALAIGAWTAAGIALVAVLGRPRIGRQAMRAWGRGMMRVLGVRVRVEGTPPPPGSLMVSNHLGYLDIPVLGAVAPMVFVARADLSGWPLWGRAARAAGTIFVDRAIRRDVVRVRREMGEALDRGDRVLVFPEATSTAGDSILPFKPALLADAAAHRRPVHWMTLAYATPPGCPPAREAVCWGGDVGFVRHAAGLLALGRVSCTVRFGRSPLQGDDRKALATRLRSEMLRDFEPSGR